MGFNYRKRKTIYSNKSKYWKCKNLWFSVDGIGSFQTVSLSLENVNFTGSTLNKQIGPLPSILPLYGNVKINYKRQKFNLTLSNNFSGRKLSQDYSKGGEDKIEETPTLNIKRGNEVYYGSPKWSIYSITGHFITVKR